VNGRRSAFLARSYSAPPLHFLWRRGIYTVDHLCRTTPRALLFQPAWLTSAERWDRQRFAGLALRDIQICLAARGLALRGDPFAAWVNETD